MPLRVQYLSGLGVGSASVAGVLLSARYARKPFRLALGVPAPQSSILI